MANRNRASGFNTNRRGDMNRNFGTGYGRSSLGSMNPWQGGSAPGMPNPEATLALANNIITNLLSNRQSNVPSLLDINVRRDFGFNSAFSDRRGPNRMGGHSGVNNRRGANNRQSNSSPRKGNKQADKSKTPKKDPIPDGEAQSEAIAVDGEENREAGEKGAEEKAMADGEEKTTEKKSTPYDDISPVFLVCHICEKKMWDGRSFDNHIRGRAHYMMMEKIRESYKMTADAMRQEQRIAEMRKEKRGNWGNQSQNRRVFCAMCDLYVGAEGAHRRSPGHQKLKRYLHPSCNVCKKEMPTRIEYEEHKLTPQHMKVLQEKSKEIPQLRNEVMQMSSMQEELSLVRTPRNRRPNNKKKAASNAEEVNGEGATAQGGETKEDGDGEAKPEGEIANEEEAVPQDDGHILDYVEGDDLTAMTKENLPRYQPDRRLAVSYIQDYTCKQCTLCKKLFDSEETAEVHTKTYVHFQNFIKLLHIKGDFKNKQESLKRDAEGDLPAEGEHDNKKPRLDTTDDINDQSGDGNWEHNDVELNGDDNADNDKGAIGQELADEDVLMESIQEQQVEELIDDSAQGRKTPGRPRRSVATRKNRV